MLPAAVAAVQCATPIARLAAAGRLLQHGCAAAAAQQQQLQQRRRFSATSELQVRAWQQRHREVLREPMPRCRCSPLPLPLPRAGVGGAAVVTARGHQHHHARAAGRQECGRPPAAARAAGGAHHAAPGADDALRAAAQQRAGRVQRWRRPQGASSAAPAVQQLHGRASHAARTAVLPTVWPCCRRCCCTNAGARGHDAGGGGRVCVGAAPHVCRACGAADADGAPPLASADCMRWQPPAARAVVLLCAVAASSRRQRCPSLL